MQIHMLLLILGGFIGELLDSSLGMLYGTILSPVLIIAGYDPLVVVPSILLTQAVGGLIAAIGHHRLHNANFSVDRDALRVRRCGGILRSLKSATTRDFKIALVVTVLGVAATVLAAFVATSISKTALNTYIGVLVLAMGAILLLRRQFVFSWRKMVGVAVLSSFNKGLSGGGFGPVVTAGQMISGQGSRGAIGATTLAEMPICIVGFLTYVLRRGMPTWDLVVFLGIGAILGAVVGPHITARFTSENKVRMGLGLLVTALGVWTLLNTWVI
jgi:uncharacterized protein